MEKIKFMKKSMLWIAIVYAAILAAIGLCFGHVIEGSLFKEVTKWIVVGLGVLGIIEGLYYVAVGPVIWHFMVKKGDEKITKSNKER